MVRSRVVNNGSLNLVNSTIESSLAGYQGDIKKENTAIIEIASLSKTIVTMLVGTRDFLQSQRNEVNRHIATLEGMLGSLERLRGQHLSSAQRDYDSSEPKGGQMGRGARNDLAREKTSINSNFDQTQDQWNNKLNRYRSIKEKLTERIESATQRIRGAEKIGSLVNNMEGLQLGHAYIALHIGGAQAAISKYNSDHASNEVAALVDFKRSLPTTLPKDHPARTYDAEYGGDWYKTEDYLVESARQNPRISIEEIATRQTNPPLGLPIFSPNPNYVVPPIDPGLLLRHPTMNDLGPTEPEYFLGAQPQSGQSGAPSEPSDSGSSQSEPAPNARGSEGGQGSSGVSAGSSANESSQRGRGHGGQGSAPVPAEPSDSGSSQSEPDNGGQGGKPPRRD